MKVLVIDVGGTHIKVRIHGKRAERKLPSGPKLTPQEMIDEVLEATKRWNYEAVSIGYPGPVRENKPVKEPVNLGDGWVDFDYAEALGRPVRMLNDAAMQALGSYDGGRMLFLGLGTGLGSALIVEKVVVPLELAHLPYRKGRSFEDYVGKAGLERAGRKKWQEHVEDVVEKLRAALVIDNVVIGGGNVKKLKSMPAGSRAGDNENAFLGGARMWQDYVYP